MKNEVFFQPKKTNNSAREPPGEHLSPRPGLWIGVRNGGNWRLERSGKPTMTIHDFQLSPGLGDARNEERLKKKRTISK